MSQETYLIGPFKQLVKLDGLPLKGPISDSEIKPLSDYWLRIKGDKIDALGNYQELKEEALHQKVIELPQGHIVLPAFIDCHTHICHGGSRYRDFAMRNAGLSYLDISRAGGGIWDTVKHTRESSLDALVDSTVLRAKALMRQGIGTIEVKSGYGLDLENELKMLKAIKMADDRVEATLISTCLSAHVKPKDVDNTHQEYLDHILKVILPQIKEQGLSDRVDVFIEEEAFSPKMSEAFLLKAKAMGFQLTVHADQFSAGGSQVAVACQALSADHLEASGSAEVSLLASSEVIPVALPGASVGIGCPFTPARALLDAGCSLAIASDWNPGSAPMGNLLTQASILATYEKLTTAEVLSGLTFRAAAALAKSDIGKICPGYKADVVMFDIDDYREILYHQGQLLPNKLIKGGVLIEL